MVISIDKAAETPLYLQIRNQIIGGIARGELAQGDSLPSVRQLAADLGINLHTVNKAYAVLRDEGYIVMRGRRGAIVGSGDSSQPNSQRDADDERMAGELYRLALEYRARGGTFDSLVDIARAQARRAFEGSK